VFKLKFKFNMIFVAVQDRRILELTLTIP